LHDSALYTHQRSRTKDIAPVAQARRTFDFRVLISAAVACQIVFGLAALAVVSFARVVEAEEEVVEVVQVGSDGWAEDLEGFFVVC